MASFKCLYSNVQFGILHICGGIVTKLSLLCDVERFPL